MNCCPNCGRNSLNKFCSVCGTELFVAPQNNLSEDDQQAKPNIWLMILSLMLFFVGIILYFVFRQRPESVKYLKMAQISAIIYAIIVFSSAFVPVIINYL